LSEVFSIARFSLGFLGNKKNEQFFFKFYEILKISVQYILMGQH
jgi:hypothetical protein